MELANIEVRACECFVVRVIKVKDFCVVPDHFLVSRHELAHEDLGMVHE